MDYNRLREEIARYCEANCIQGVLRVTIVGKPDFAQSEQFAAAYAPGYARFARAHLKRLAEYPSFFPPGTNALYANVNFVLCALIIENVAGMCYSDYMQQEVFAPLGMPHAVVDNETLTIPNRVKGYELVDGQMSEVEKSHNWLLGARDIVATADDVYCLNTAIENRLLLGRGNIENGADTIAS